jgi:hypothetical protein
MYINISGWWFSLHLWNAFYLDFDIMWFAVAVVAWIGFEAIRKKLMTLYYTRKWKGKTKEDPNE